MTDTSDGGFAADHPPQAALHVLASPTTADEFNAIRDALVTVACWRLDDTQFEFDSSFVVPEARAQVQKLATLRKSWPTAPISLFAHADPVGDDAYNKKLSGRRARSTYGLLTRDVDMWEALYGSAEGTGDTWGLRVVQRMLKALGFYGNTVDGINGKDTQRALKNFQAENGEAESGQNTAATRKKLYLAYMNRVCMKADGQDFRLAKAEFLGKNEDPDGHADFQGCSEFNPITLLSEAEFKELNKPADKTARNAANAPNRRVVAFFFKPGTTIQVARWPCPKAKEGVAKCTERFWSDGDSRRRKPGEAHREYRDTKDTFACRFYDRLARRSPCEAGFKEWVLRVLDSTPGPLKDSKPLLGTPFVVTGSGGGEVRGETDANGVLRFMAPTDTAEMELRIAGLVVRLNGGVLPDIDAPDAVGVRHRLYNLGYGEPERAQWFPPAPSAEAILFKALKSFQHENGLTESGAADDPTRAKLKELHGS